MDGRRVGAGREGRLLEDDQGRIYGVAETPMGVALEFGLHGYGFFMFFPNMTCDFKPMKWL